MDIAEKVLRAKTDLDDVYEAGKKAEYDEFWDTFQENGSRTNYGYAFYKAWNDVIFKPKYDIKPITKNDTDGMFQYSQITNLTKLLNKQGVKLDFSECARLNATFDRSKITDIPPIDAKNIKSMAMAFYSCSQLTKLELNNVREDCTFDRTFSYLRLTELIISGIIGNNGFDVHWSKNLTAESIDSIVRALTTAKSGLTITLPVGAYNRHAERYGASVTEALWAEKRAHWSINELAV